MHGCLVIHLNGGFVHLSPWNVEVPHVFYDETQYFLKDH